MLLINFILTISVLSFVSANLPISDNSHHVIRVKLYSDDPEVQKGHFKEFKGKFKKGGYKDSAEENKRFSIFVENLKIADDRNTKEEYNAIHGITQFSDLSQTEFENGYLGYGDKKKICCPPFFNFIWF